MLIPRSAEEITPEWLASALGRDDIAGVAIEDAGGMRGFAGAVLRLRLDIEGRGGHAGGTGAETLIAKLPGVDRFDAALAESAYVAYATEVEWYRELRSRCPVRAPHPYWLGAQADEGRFCLLLEDLAALEEADHATGASDEQAFEAVRTLGRLHAAHWPQTTALPVRFADRTATARRAEAAAGALTFGWEHVFATFGPLMPDHLLAARPLLEDALPRLGDTFRGPATLIHGDYKVENLLFGAAPPPERVAVLDWQATGCGFGAEDLARFLGTSVASERRRRLERELLEAYRDVLAANGVASYAFDDLWHDYRAALLIELGRTIGGARHAAEGTFASTDPARQRAVEEQVRTGLERRIDAIVHSGALELLDEARRAAG